MPGGRGRTLCRVRRLGQVFELVTQLRHEAGQRQVEGCRLALAENGGGNLGFEEAAMCVHILERVSG